MSDQRPATSNQLPATSFQLQCPIPISDYPVITLAHGGGGRLTQMLIDRLFVPAFGAQPGGGHDGAMFSLADFAAAGGGRLAFSTDSFVVSPRFFPGGDIGSLAVHGTVNDLAMCGARPRWLSAGFILEEGLEMETLQRVVQSMRDAARAAGVELVTGDTKVVDKGKGDGLFVNTAGIGIREHPGEISPRQVRAGDQVILSGDLGRHGMAIISTREGLEFESPIESDCAPLASAVLSLLDDGIPVHCLRDLTRGGLTAALNEIAEAGGVQIDIEEPAVPVSESVRGACEILGFDPMYVANEGRFIAFVPAGQAGRALELLRRQPAGAESAVIGSVQTGTAGLVTLRSRIGVRRVLDRLSGEQLPRIC